MYLRMEIVLRALYCLHLRIVNWCDGWVVLLVLRTMDLSPFSPLLGIGGSAVFSMLIPLASLGPACSLLRVLRVKYRSLVG